MRKPAANSLRFLTKEVFSIRKTKERMSSAIPVGKCGFEYIERKGYASATQKSKGRFPLKISSHPIPDPSDDSRKALRAKSGRSGKMRWKKMAVAYRRKPEAANRARWKNSSRGICSQRAR